MDNKKFDMKTLVSNFVAKTSWSMMLTGMIVMIACAIGALAKLFSGHFLAALILFLIAAAAFFFVNFVVKLDDRNIKKEKREYRQNYITEMKVIDLELGELYFEHDSKLETLTLLHGVPALCGEGDLEIEAEDAGMNTTPIIECAKRLIKDKDKIVEGMAAVVADTYDQEDITEEEAGGIPTDREYILSHLSIDTVDLSANEDGSWVASVRGYMNNSVEDHIGEHGLTAELSSDSPDYDFYSG